MDEVTKANLDTLKSPDGEARYQALNYVLEVTARPVDWAYDVWDEMLATLRHENNHQRAIAAQVLCNLAKSDPDGRMLKDFEALLTATKDEKFVTARHTLQAIWKVGLAGKKQQKLLINGLQRRFHECSTEKNYTLIRYDILHCFKQLYDQVQDETIRAKALEFIELEEDPKYRKKYASLWKMKSISQKGIL